MKLKKVFLVGLFIIIILAGCSKKSTSPSENIDQALVGKWYLSSYIEDGESYDMEGYVNFSSDGKINGEFRDDEDGILVTYSGTYSTSNSTITTKITESSQPEWLETKTYKWNYSISGNLLKMDELENEEDPVHLTYTNQEPDNDNGGSINGTVTSTSKGEPIEGVFVELINTAYSDLTDEQGHYSIEGIPEGNYSVKFSKNGFEDFIQSNVQITSGTTVTINVSLTISTTGYGEVNGFVFDALEQVPIPNARIEIQGTNFVTETDTSGYYEFSQVPTGQYTITASKSGYDSQDIQVQVLAGEEENVDFILLPEGTNTFGTLQGRVTNQNGQPVKNVLVQLVGFYNQMLTDENGEYQLVAVPEGSYTVTFSKTGYETVTEENVEVISQEETTLDIVINQIEGVGNLTCYVQNILEIPINGALVEILNTSFSATTNLAGTCQIKNIPTGIYSVKVSKSGYQTEVIDNVEIITGIPTQVLNVTLRN